MTGRRRHTRFRLAAPLEGTLDVREEVAIERWADTEIEVSSMVPCRVGERLSLELAGDSDGELHATVLDVQPVVAPDGSLFYRLRLAFEAGQSTAPGEGHSQS